MNEVTTLSSTQGSITQSHAHFLLPHDFDADTPFELFIGFKLHTIHTSKIVPMMLSVSVVVAHNARGMESDPAECNPV
jgi:hypothetical protein